MTFFQRLLALFRGGQAPSVSDGAADAAATSDGPSVEAPLHGAPPHARVIPDSDPGSPSVGRGVTDSAPPHAGGLRQPTTERGAPTEIPDHVRDDGGEGKAVGASSSPSAAPAVRTLIVGIGNPGGEYEATRHNAGFLAVERLAERLGVAFPDADPPRTRLAQGVWDGRGVALAQPQAYMNRSGPPLAALMEHYGLDADRVLLVYDDLALPPGQIRLRGKGSAGGHNGVQSVIDALGSSEFPRLRIGIGDRFERGGLVDYVLAPFPDDELPDLDAALDLAAQAALAFAADGLNAAMNVYNRRA